METTNSVIVYRNPLEKQMWESTSGSVDLAILFIVGGIVWAILFTFFYAQLEKLKLIQKCPKVFKHKHFIGVTASVLAVISVRLMWELILVIF